MMDLGSVYVYDSNEHLSVYVITGFNTPHNGMETCVCHIFYSKSIRRRASDEYSVFLMEGSPDIIRVY